jgi:hypothetical protein
MTKIPKIHFVYSYVYDNTLTNLIKQKYRPNTRKFALSYIERLTKAFDKISDKSLAEMSKLSGLKWQKDYIEVYVVKYAPYSFSIPLTLKMYKDINKSVAVLVHELAHNLVSQNKARIRYRELFQDYKRYDTDAKFHLIEGSILVLLNKKLFGSKSKGFFKYDNWYGKGMPHSYAKVMDVVSKENKEIIKEYIKP